jgi:hypothetical protein
MKKTASILLFLFVLFLITPAVVSAIENDADISVVSSFSEEEQVLKDIKLALYYNQVFKSVNSANVVSKTILSENTLKHDDVALGIFIPPPELI